MFKDVIEQIVCQIFYFVNAHCLLALLDPGAKRCKVGSAIVLKLGITQLEMWAENQKLKRCSRELMPLREATAVILIHKKSSLVDRETISEVAPTLSLAQVKKILKRYQPDEFDPNSIPSSVLKSLSSHMKRESSNRTCQEEYDNRVIKRLNCDLDEEIPNYKLVQIPAELLAQEGLQFLNQ